eukprot:gene11493-21710_t
MANIIHPYFDVFPVLWTLLLMSCFAIFSNQHNVSPVIVFKCKRPQQMAIKQYFSMAFKNILELANSNVYSIGFNVETVTYKNLKFQVWDLGGQTSIRPYWRCYYANTDAVIYVVDSQDRDRIGISKQELVAMLEEEELQKAVLVVLANKQDMEGSMSATDVSNALGLSALKSRSWSIFKTSAIKGEGLDEAMDWLVNALKTKQ